jgi:hypothetical protein
MSTLLFPATGQPSGRLGHARTLPTQSREHPVMPHVARAEAVGSSGPRVRGVVRSWGGPAQQCEERGRRFNYELAADSGLGTPMTTERLARGFRLDWSAVRQRLGRYGMPAEVVVRFVGLFGALFS